MKLQKCEYDICLYMPNQLLAEWADDDRICENIEKEWVTRRLTIEEMEFKHLKKFGWQFQSLGRQHQVDQSQWHYFRWPILYRGRPLTRSYQVWPSHKTPCNGPWATCSSSRSNALPLHRETCTCAYCILLYFHVDLQP